MSDWQFLKRFYLTALVVWLLGLPLGFLAPEPVVAFTFICVFGSLFMTALVVIWGDHE